MRRVRRCKDDRALLEGPHLVMEALAAGLDPESVLATPEFLEREEGWELARRLGGAPDRVRDDLLASVMDADSPRGVAAVVRLPRRGADGLPVVPDGLYLFAERLQDPGNLGALVRSAEAAGAAGVALSLGCAHPNHPRALRASAGSLLRLPVALGAEPADLDAHLGALSPRWLALAVRGGEELWRCDLSGALVLAVGAEGPGLSRELSRRADLRLTIPMAAPVESLNATVAASLVLFEVRRRHGAPDAAGGAR